tara:strand:+ start:563 stop:1348 length:786 start_codon:yes stop_codon:yes gene_type:complete
MKLSIIIPVYNSCKILEKLITEINSNLSDKFEKNYEIILVNDSSKDNSWVVIKKISRELDYVKGIDLHNNVGQHGAIFVGLKHSIGNKIIIMDDDLQHPPKSLISIYQQLDLYDACYTLYSKRKHVYWKIFVSKVNNFFSSFIFDKPFKIYTSSMKGIRSDVKDKFIGHNPKIPFIDSLILKEAKNITSIKVNHQERFEGKSNYDVKKLFVLWFDMIENYHFYPLRFGSLIGLISFCIVKLLRIFNAKKSFSFEIKEKTFN